MNIKVEFIKINYLIPEYDRMIKNYLNLKENINSIEIIKNENNSKKSSCKKE